MKHLRLPVLLTFCLAISLLVVFPGSAARAQTRIPATVNCSTGCISNGEWDDWVKGGIVKFTVEDPLIHISNGSFRRDLFMINGTQEVDIGISVESSTTGGCGKKGDWFFAEAVNALGQVLFLKCVGIPLQDVGLDVTFQESYFTSNGGGMFFKITDPGNTMCSTGCFVSGMGTSYNIIFEQEGVYDTWTGTEVALSGWSKSQYQSTTGVWTYQSRNFDFLTTSNPPQMYWHTVPAPGNNGGLLYSCDKETGTTC